MMNQLERIERRQEVIETKFNSHDAKDEERFDTVQKSFVAIRQLVSDSMDKIDRKLSMLQDQIDPLNDDKIRAEGYAKGVEDTKEPGRQWAQLIIPGILIALLTFTLSALGSWVVHDIYNGPNHESKATLTTTSTMSDLIISDFGNRYWGVDYENTVRLY